MFGSDNAAPAHPAILEAIARANTGVASSYGADDWTKRAEALLRETFETECAVLLVATGTAANALSLASLTPPWGAVITHRHAHIVEDEGGAPEFYMGGAKLLLVDGAHGKIAPAALKKEAAKYSRPWVHGAQPFAVSISQATETGAVYMPAEISALSEVCRAANLKLHMDGARFANAVASTGATPAELSWKAGVDVLSFGATKNGALCVEAVVCFDPAAATQLPHLRKRAGHLFSKHRVLGAQMAAYLEGGLWLELARHSNARARELAGMLTRAGGVLAHPVEANETFVRLDGERASALRSAGAAFHPWATDGADIYRFVASWATSEADIEACRKALEKI
ncbi:MAG: threonine aldolase [Alphaproteobacteria bacterium]|nr:MAG: threonine aldolase [Caulobacteraceae bacterium]TPW02078.1 MAG: threonine aldolase [Alphaproteobacteria bacterium]